MPTAQKESGSTTGARPRASSRRALTPAEKRIDEALSTLKVDELRRNAFLARLLSGKDPLSAALLSGISTGKFEDLQDILGINDLRTLAQEAITTARAAADATAETSGQVLELREDVDKLREEVDVLKGTGKYAALSIVIALVCGTVAGLIFALVYHPVNIVVRNGAQITYIHSESANLRAALLAGAVALLAWIVAYWLLDRHGDRIAEVYRAQRDANSPTVITVTPVTSSVPAKEEPAAQAEPEAHGETKTYPIVGDKPADGASVPETTPPIAGDVSNLA